MKVLLIEDNKNHADSVKKCLNKAFSDVNLAVLRTEHEVLSAMEKVSQENPDIIILDVILPWCDLCENMPELPKNYEGGPYRAGIRCLKAFLNHKKLKNIT